MHDLYGDGDGSNRLSKKLSPSNLSIAIQDQYLSHLTIANRTYFILDLPAASNESCWCFTKLPVTRVAGVFTKLPVTRVAGAGNDSCWYFHQAASNESC